LGSSAEFLQVPYGQSRYYALRGKFDQAQSLADDLLRFSGQRNDPAGLVLGHYCSGRNLMYMGNFVRSQLHLETVLVLYDSVAHGSLVRQTGTNPQTASRGILGIDMLILGYPDHALACSASAIAEDRTSVHPPSLANDLAVRNIVLSLIGDDRAMNGCADELVALAAEQGFPLWSALGATFRGWAKVKTGDVVEGMSLLQNGATAFHATGADILMPYFLTLLARAFECTGQIAEALIQLEDALRIVERTGERWFEAEINRHQGRLLLCQGRPGDAEERYRKALGIAREQQAKMWELRAAISLARLHRNQGRRAEACDLLMPVHGWFTEGFATPDLKEAKALLDQLT
jgi:predicted ATPase